MIVNNIFSRILFGILASCCLLACRGELPVLPSDEIEVGKDPLGGVHIKGMYLLNEGNMGSNKCTLDFYDSTTGKYHRNIYAERNPSVVKELGDVGNDLQIYGDKLYAVINCSNFIEVMDVETAQHLGQINVTNCRYITFNDYDRTVSVIDLKTFQVIKTIDVAINLHRMKLDRYGRIYVSSRGDYYGTGSDVFIIDTQTDRVTGNLGIAASEMCLSGDSIYMTSVEWSYVTESNTITYALYDVKQNKIVSRNFITDGTETEITIPYGIAVNPETKEIFVTDAKSYVVPGYLYCFSPEGKKRWKVRAGDIPITNKE